MTRQTPFSFDVPSVSELTSEIKELLEGEFLDILVEGEISNLKQSRNGHIYFTLKDEQAQLPCVIWRSTAERTGISLADGRQIVAGGDLQVYAPHGRYQMIVTLIQQAGAGRLQQKFEELKKKLFDEGLFSDAHKKQLPLYPQRIGVITSATGAAFHDIRSTIEQRWPVASLLLVHASVQGANASGELVNALRYFSENPGFADVIIIGRGGGSIEDLWPFNEEAVARAIFSCPVPVVSAVGHEVDYSISDFVADVRAATPTQAVIAATPDINDIRMKLEYLTFALEETLNQKIDRYKKHVELLTRSTAVYAVKEKLNRNRVTLHNFEQRLKASMVNRLFGARSRIRLLESKLAGENPSQLILQHRMHAEHINEKLNERIWRKLETKRAALTQALAKLEENNPKTPLLKGFTRTLQHGKWIRSKAALSPDLPVEIEWSDGRQTIGKR
ncbi:MAG: exodeoxyribonuclease VII large subunit [Balneolaceae bacterium]|nr:MAG: exodeoxyribonuclease VII large subunit [Balneolaceae bacterium]